MKPFSCLLLLLVLCLVAPCVLSQSTSATISGGITDPTGNFITGASVLIVNDETGILYSVRSNSSGMYFVPILPPGHYHLQISKQGFKTIIKPDVVLNVQSAVALNFVLPIGATSQSITVEAGSSLLNTTDATVSTVIDRKFVENIPLNGRSFQDLISMTPGVVTQSPQTQYQAPGQNGDFSVNGQRTESNNYSVDGVSGNISAGYRHQRRVVRSAED
jgi:Carboxypeptidase regulatory-like domain